MVPFPLDAHRRGRLESALRAAVGEEHPELAATARYVLGWEDEQGRPSNHGGKRLRPSLCLFACEVLNGSFEDALPASAAVELVHNFSLVHDEVQDRDAERHGRPTIWTRFGEAQAINVGDYLYARAMRAAIAGPAPAERRVEAAEVLMSAVADMVQGQWRDLTFEERAEVGEDDYLKMVAAKTGALFGAPLEMGAILAGAERSVSRVLGRWGRQVGLAFQAQDDYLGIWGDPNLTGKSNTNDIARRKKTLPIILGWRDPRAREVIAGEYGRPEGAAIEVSEVVAALEKAGAESRSREVARLLAAEAATILDGLGLSEGARLRFGEIAGLLVNRSI